MKGEVGLASNRSGFQIIFDEGSLQSVQQTPSVVLLICDHIVRNKDAFAFLVTNHDRLGTQS